MDFTFDRAQESAHSGAMEQQNHIISAYELLDGGKAKQLAGDEQVASRIEAGKPVWVHMEAVSQKTHEWLRENISGLDDLTIEALLQTESRPRLSEQKDSIMLILRGVNLNEGAEPEDMISIRVWSDGHRIISTQWRSLLAIADVREAMERGKGPATAADFIVMLVAKLTERMEPVLQELSERTDNIEEKILDHPTLPDLHEITDIRRQAIILHRYIAPQRDVVSYLRNCTVRWFDNGHKRQMIETLDRITRHVEDLDAIRDRAQIVKDEMANNLAERMNKNMYMLSIVSTIFLPLTFMTGLLGINVAGIPGAESPVAFWIVLLLCLSFAGVLLGYFRYRKWL